jgi:hypothetical protein
MPLEIIAASILAIMGPVIFGHFTRHSPLRGKILKAVVYVAIAVVLTVTVGRPWSLIWTFGAYGLALVVHVGWCIAHGIHLLHQRLETSTWQSVVGRTSNSRRIEDNRFLNRLPLQRLEPYARLEISASRQEFHTSPSSHQLSPRSRHPS